MRIKCITNLKGLLLKGTEKQKYEAFRCPSCKKQDVWRYVERVPGLAVTSDIVKCEDCGELWQIYEPWNRNEEPLRKQAKKHF